MMVGFLKPFMQLMGLGTEATNLPTNLMSAIPVSGNNSACMICYHCSLIISTHSFILGGSTQRTHHKIIGLYCQFKHS